MSREPRVTGRPEMRYLVMISRAWRRVMSGEMVTGSTIMPLSERFTRSTSSTWRSMGMIAVNDADATLARDGDGQAGFGDGVHGGGGEGNVELELAGEMQVRVSTSVGRTEDLPGQEKHVVESETFGDGTVDHGSLENWDLIMGLDRRAQTEVCATGGRSKVEHDGPAATTLGFVDELRSKSTGRSACATTLEFGDEFRAKSTD